MPATPSHGADSASVQPIDTTLVAVNSIDQAEAAARLNELKAADDQAKAFSLLLSKPTLLGS